MMHGVLKRIFNSFCSCKAISGRILLAWCFVQVSICADSDGWEVVIHERATGINSSSGDELRSVAAAADSYFGGFFGWRIGEVEIEPPTPTGTTCTNLDNTIFIDGTLSVLVNSTAGVSLTRATFSSFGIGLELTAKQAGLNWLWAGTLYMESNLELQPSVQHFSMWIRARGIGLLPFPMCHATTMSRVFWTLLGFDILSANVSSIVGISGPGKDRNYQTPAPPSYPLAPSPPPYPLAPTWDQGTRRLLTNVHQKSRRGGKEIEEHPFKVKNPERADRRLFTQEPGLNTYAMPLTISGELDVIDIQLNIQTTDPTATVEKMDKYMALESTKFLVLAYAATWAVNLHDYKLLNATVSKGWVNRTRGVVTTLVWGDDAFKTSLAPGPGPSAGPSQIFPAATGKGSDGLQIIGAGASGGGSLTPGAYLGIALAALAVVVVVVAAGVLGRRCLMRNLKGLETKESSPTASPELLDLWRISRDDIEICRHTDGSQWLLGTGAYGKVFKGRCRGVQEVALKFFHPNMAQEVRAIVEHEVGIMKIASYDNHVVRFYGACVDDHPTQGPILVMEYCQDGSLCHILQHDEIQGEYSWHKKGHQLALDIARGLAFLHSVKIVHRDLKTSNVLVSKNRAKICDVGMAKILTGADFTTSLNPAGTFAYAAPELLMGDRYSEQVDIYSFGVVLWEICGHDRPTRGQLRFFDDDQICPPEIEELISQCLKSEPSARPSAAELIDRLLASERLWQDQERKSERLEVSSSTSDGGSSQRTIEPKYNSGMLPPSDNEQ